MKPKTIAKFLPISTKIVGILFVIASNIFPNLALGGGMEFHIAGIVYSIVKPHSVEIQDKRVVEVPGQISVVEDRSDRTRTVEFSTRDEQKFKVISSIHQGDHVTIDGEIFENEQHLLFIRVDGSGGTRGNPTVSPESTVSR